MEYVTEDFLLRYSKEDIRIIRMRAVVDDTVHVQVEVVELWHLQEVMESKIKVISLIS